MGNEFTKAPDTNKDVILPNPQPAVMARAAETSDGPLDLGLTESASRPVQQALAAPSADTEQLSISESRLKPSAPVIHNIDASVAPVAPVMAPVAHVAESAVNLADSEPLILADTEQAPAASAPVAAVEHVAHVGGGSNIVHLKTPEAPVYTEMMDMTEMAQQLSKPSKKTGGKREPSLEDSSSPFISTELYNRILNGGAFSLDGGDGDDVDRAIKNINKSDSDKSSVSLSDEDEDEEEEEMDDIKKALKKDDSSDEIVKSLKDSKKDKRDKKKKKRDETSSIDVKRTGGARYNFSASSSEGGKQSSDKKSDSTINTSDLKILPASKHHSKH
ncbi:MAG: hypothetical protein Faunusvirus3_9 [Faunusvirus sp.]|jgi:hypothetical protein|uniref:Uncharacterized protein n=1 Tax=Faunusvirus sp. TaxID=2487766 RepID=A0A3G5A0P1_9VIRU|nr:MAG: hypothetical protein Faunusvirus3_9 [Faunusvirus sp.]